MSEPDDPTVAPSLLEQGEQLARTTTELELTAEGAEATLETRIGKGWRLGGYARAQWGKAKTWAAGVRLRGTWGNR